MSKTSWSDEDLESLCNPNNHKIYFDGFEYWWQHKIHGNKWETHSIQPYDNWKKPYGHIKYWLAKYAKELADRRVNDAKSIFDTMKIHDQIMEIAKSNIKTKNKINAIRNLMPDAEITYMSNVLNISRQAVHKHFKSYEKT